jgi:DNA-binding MarR family transcriptional regulator
VEQTARGRKTVEAAIAKAKISNEETLATLTAAERKTLIHLLGRLSD